MFEFLTALLAVLILLSIACPKRFFPEREQRKVKRVHSSYWGVYHGTPLHADPSAPTVEVPKPMRKWKVVAGSQMYAGGNGRGR
jgi:hypothetical protein